MTSNFHHVLQGDTEELIKHLSAHMKKKGE
jgi:hypothetical protein